MDCSYGVTMSDLVGVARELVDSVLYASFRRHCDTCEEVCYVCAWSVDKSEALHEVPGLICGSIVYLFAVV